jgi:hypothetical protein
MCVLDFLKFSVAIDLPEYLDLLLHSTTICCKYKQDLEADRQAQEDTKIYLGKTPNLGENTTNFS